MSMMGIAPGAPPQINLAALMQSQAVEIEQGLKKNLPNLFANLATLNANDTNQP
jgi:hypothetical protein